MELVRQGRWLGHRELVGKGHWLAHWELARWRRWRGAAAAARHGWAAGCAKEFGLRLGLGLGEIHPGHGI